MGEAKRRKKNDPSFGQPKILTLNLIDTNKFLNGLLDLIVTEPENTLPILVPETEESITNMNYSLKEEQSKMQLVLPINQNENPAREYLLENWSLVWDSISKMVMAHGNGIIYQEAQLEKDITRFHFIPNNEENLRSIETQVFNRNLGKIMGSVVRSTIRYLDWSKYIPVLAMATKKGKKSALFYIIDYDAITNSN